MQCGISTACFYPEDTLEALKRVVATGAPVTEIFLNTFSEVKDAYIHTLLDTVKTSGIRVSAIHPFSSAMEGFYFATGYNGRFEDGIRLYRKIFLAAQTLGANKLVFHGDHAGNARRFGWRAYARNVNALAEVGLEYGIKLCCENVSYCRLGDPQAVRKFKPALTHPAFVLDIKQVRRFGAPLPDMLQAMGGDICHVHISDYLSSAQAAQFEDWLPPGKGEVDFSALIAQLQALGFTGDLMIELYRDGFATDEDLAQAMRYIQALLPAE